MTMTTAAGTTTGWTAFAAAAGLAMMQGCFAAGAPAGVECSDYDNIECPAGQLCVDFHCAPVCTPGDSGLCPADKACIEGTCQTYSQTCETADDCIDPAWYCSESGTCIRKLPLGSACGASDNHCDSAHCVEGVCCNEACGDECMACLGEETGGETGVCLAVQSGTDPRLDCDTNGACIGTMDGASCACSAGYEGNGASCVDIDECAASTDNCDANATCSNTMGGFTCSCNSGYEGDGITCTDVNECALGLDNCDANATCSNTAGDFTCMCNDGYQGNGLGCVDVNECADGLDNCDANATCTNTVGGFSCACNSTYTGDGVTCHVAMLQVTAGEIHTCAIRVGGTLWCWGDNSYAQLGDGVAVLPGTTRSVPTQIGTGKIWTQVAAGGRHTCAIQSDKSLWCWGDNTYSQLGAGSVNTFEGAPTQVGTATDWIAVAAGGRHTCAIRTGGGLWCWGSDTSGQVGDDVSHTVQEVPVAIVPTRSWAQVAAGGMANGSNGHTCAIGTDGTLWCWGSNSFGQLGDGSTTLQTSPTQVGSLDTWSSVAIGFYDSCATRSDGTLRCWGHNQWGAVGDGTTTERSAPVVVPEMTGIGALDVGGEHTCAVASGGALWCWGWGRYGQLGNDARGPGEYKTSPIQVLVSATAAQVVTGGSHSCSILSDHTLWCWGYNASGQVGNGATVPGADVTVPTLIAD